MMETTKQDDDDDHDHDDDDNAHDDDNLKYVFPVNVYFSGCQALQETLISFFAKHDDDDNGYSDSCTRL